ncbi:MAG: helix-turn-helix domain-containing protein [Myxococcota bacterium]|nr:helix-turn-helix domain-containing protein [Myxococcota bacterium]
MSRKPQPEGALYVKLPATAVGKLDRAAETLGIRKKDLVAGLVARYVDPDSQRGRSELGQLSQPRRPPVATGPGPELGSYSFQPYELPEVMTAEQAGQFLQLTEAAVLELAERGELPCRKLGGAWRFSRTALLDWLASAPPTPTAKPARR